MSMLHNNCLSNTSDISREITNPVHWDCRARIGAMALVHETLYRSDNLAQVDCCQYLQRLCQNMGRAHGLGRGEIELTVHVSDIFLGIDQAIAIGMIINELISNTFKYAFPEGRQGEITVAMREIGGGETELVVQDDGVGLPSNVDISGVETLGLSLVQDAVVSELGGSIEIDRDRGTRFTIRFKCRSC